MPPDVPAPVRLARRTVYESHFVNLHLDRVRFPGDRVIEDYTVLGFDTEAAAALVDDADGNLLLVESYATSPAPSSGRSPPVTSTPVNRRWPPPSAKPWRRPAGRPSEYRYFKAPGTRLGRGRTAASGCLAEAL